MKYGNFSVSIPQGVETDGGYIKLPHNTQYQIKLENHDYTKRCAAEVKVDGKVVGLFRISAGGMLNLERPSHDVGKFTFYKDGTSEAKAAGLETVNYNDRGLVQVVFKPEKNPIHKLSETVVISPPISWPRYDFDKPRRYGFAACSDTEACIGSADVSEPRLASNSVTKGLSSGGTGLSGQSGQTFKTVGNLDYDENAFVTISLRLVASEEGPRPLTASPRSTPVPSPV